MPFKPSFFVLAVLSPLLLAAATEEQVAAFAPYQAIIDRMPFGVPPPDPAGCGGVLTPEAAEQQQQQQELAKKIGMCAVNIAEGAVKVGFIDNGQNPPRSYYLAVGESRDGFKVLEADWEGESATIERDGVTVSLKLGEGLVQAKPPRKGGADSAAEPRRAGRPVRLTPPAGVEPPPLAAGRATRIQVTPSADAGAEGAEGGAHGQSYAARLRQRRDSLRRERMAQARAIRVEAEREAEERLAGEEERIRREAQMDLVTGRDQIELTPDEDAQLVQEGRLEPQ